MGELECRLAVLSNIPTPYRDEYYRHVAQQSGLRLHVFYLGATHPKRRNWRVQPQGYAHSILSNRVVEFSDKFALHPVLRATRAIQQHDPHVLIISGWDQPAYWEALLRLGRAAPTVGWIETHHASGRNRHRWSDRLRAAYLTRLAAVITPGQEASDYIRSLGAAPRELILPNPVPPPPASTEAAAPTGAVCRLLFVGALTPRKNPQRVLDIARAVSTREASCEVTFVGVGPLEAGLRRRATELPFDVHFRGWQTGAALETEWQSASCLVLPSLADPAPIVFSEAAARGVPILASSNCGGVSALKQLGASAAILDLERDDDDEWAAHVLRMRARYAPVTAVTCGPSAARLAQFARGLLA